MSKVWTFSTLSPASSAPATIRPGFSPVFIQKHFRTKQPAFVEEAREAGGGEGPVVLWDAKAASLPPFSPTQNYFKKILP